MSQREDRRDYEQGLIHCYGIKITLPGMSSAELGNPGQFFTITWLVSLASLILLFSYRLCWTCVFQWNKQLGENEGRKLGRYIIKQNLPTFKNESLPACKFPQCGLHTLWAGEFMSLLFLKPSSACRRKDSTISFHSFPSYKFFCSSPFPPLPIRLPLLSQCICTPALSASLTR